MKIKELKDNIGIEAFNNLNFEVLPDDEIIIIKHKLVGVNYE